MQALLVGTAVSGDLLNRVRTLYPIPCVVVAGLSHDAGLPITEGLTSDHGRFPFSLYGMHMREFKETTQKQHHDSQAGFIIFPSSPVHGTKDHWTSHGRSCLSHVVFAPVPGA